MIDLLMASDDMHIDGGSKHDTGRGVEEAARSMLQYGEQSRAAARPRIDIGTCPY